MATAPTSAAFARTTRGSGPGLLLAHGAGGGIEANYGPILDGLAAHRTAVGVDYPGTGATPKSEVPLELDAIVDELLAAADAEGLDTFAVSGYSLGGPVALRLAARHPERVEALVLTATFAHADARTGLAASVWHKLYTSGQHALLGEFLTLMALSGTALDSLSPEQVEAVAQGTAETLPPGTGEHVDLVRRVDVRADLAAVKAPTLVVVTAGDPLIAPALQRELAAGLPHAEVAELPTGHLPFVERPQEWLGLINGFLARH